MANDLIRMLLQAELDKESISKIQAQLKNIEKNSKPIEIEVITDKAEIAMSNFAKSMGIKLNKDLKGQFKDLSSNLLGDFDQSKFDNLAKGIVNAYKMAMDKNSKKIQFDFFENSDDKKIYDYLKGSILKLDDSTINAKKNVDGFNGALKGLVKTSKESGLSLDQMAQELNSMGIKDLGVNTEDIASKLTKSVKNVRDVKNGFIELGDSVPDKEINEFVQNELMDLLTGLGKIEYESKQAKDSLKQINSVQDEFTKTNTAIDSIETNIKGLGVVNRKTFKDMNDDVYKYIDTYKNLEKGINISDTYAKNDQGGFDFTGRIIDDKSAEYNAKQSIKNAKEELSLVNAMADGREKANIRASKSYESLQQSQAKASNKAIEDNYKQQLSEEKINKTLREQIELYQKKMRGNMDIFADKNKGKFDEVQLDNLRQKMEGLSISSGNAKREMKDITIEMGHMQKAASQSNSMLSKITENLVKFARFYIVGQAVVEVVRAAREGVKSIKELDASLTELSKVSDMSTSQLKNFTDQAYEAGKTIGRTGKEVIDATAEFKRAGYEINEAFELSQQALLLTNIGDGMDDVKESSSSLIAILKGFKMEAQETAHVVDALNEVSNNYAVDTNNLTEILKRTSGTISQTGTSYEELLGLATGGFESLRNAEMVASGINMISQRLRGNQIIKYYAPYVQKCA